MPARKKINREKVKRGYTGGLSMSVGSHRRDDRKKDEHESGEGCASRRRYRVVCMLVRYLDKSSIRTKKQRHVTAGRLPLHQLIVSIHGTYGIGRTDSGDDFMCRLTRHIAQRQEPSMEFSTWSRQLHLVV